MNNFWNITKYIPQLFMHQIIEIYRFVIDLQNYIFTVSKIGFGNCVDKT